MADLDRVDVRAAAIAIIEEQRATPHDVHGLFQAHVVGGFAELTTVSEAGIVREILRRWPDRIGEHIQPFAS